jgi:hypothetical protein
MKEFVACLLETRRDANKEVTKIEMIDRIKQMGTVGTRLVLYQRVTVDIATRAAGAKVNVEESSC